MAEQVDIQIRPLMPGELGLLKAVAVASFDKTFAPHNTPENMEFYYRTYYSTEQMHKDLVEPGAACFMAWSGDAAVGFVRLRRNDEVKEALGPHTIELHRLYIHPDHQGKQVGTRLMQHALDYGVRNQCQWLWLGVWERNVKAQQFYQKWGFEKFAEHVFQMGDDPQVDWLLRKRLTKEGSLKGRS